MTLPVFWCPQVFLVRGSSLAEFNKLSSALVGDFVGVPGDEGHHMAAVRRLLGGEVVDLVDGQGLRGRCRVCGRAQSQELFELVKTGGEYQRVKNQKVEKQSKNWATKTGKNSFEDARIVKIWLEVCEIISAEKPRLSLTLVQALAKNGRDEQAIETATELGVDRVVAWQADRSVVRWNSPKREKHLERWQKILVAAAKQSRRATFPKLLGCMNSAELTRWLQTQSQSGAVTLVCHEEAHSKLTEILHTKLADRVGLDDSPKTNNLSKRKELANKEIILVVGPEGGISESEMEDFCAAKAESVSLGERILRSSTAGPVALAAIATWMGEM